MAALGIALFALSACGQGDEEATRLPAGPLEPHVVEVFPHDPNAFTQGLVIHDGYFYEGTGQYGRSSLRKVEIATGNVERSVALDPSYFGEGITILGDRIYQLTWQRGTGFVYDLESFANIGDFRYTGEGWGLTHDGEHLVMSDGTASLRFLDPETFEVVRTLEVRDGERPVVRLNELEYVEGEIWSNVWYEDRIARIAPDTGAVIGWIDLASLFPRSRRGSEDVLNGIAYDAATKRTFVTGKNWPVLFELRFD